MKSILGTMKIEKMEQIYYTKDYDKFKFTKDNRKVKISEDLKNSIASKGILEPIAVNESMEIIDGQHRFSVAKEIGVSIPFKIISGLSLGDVLDTKATTRNWTSGDFIEYHVKHKNPNYIRLVNLKKSEALAENQLVLLYHFGKYTESGAMATRVIKDSSLNMWAHKEFGDKAVGQYQDLQSLINIRKKSMIRALFEVMSNPNYNHERMKNQLVKFGATVLFDAKKWNGHQTCIKLREVYNFKQRDKVDIYDKDRF